MINGKLISQHMLNNRFVIQQYMFYMNYDMGRMYIMNLSIH